MHAIIAWFARNDVAANLLMATIVALGIYSVVAKIPLEVFPSVELDEVRINMVLRGATPSEVEDSLAVRIEESIQDLEGVDRILSSSREGAVQVRVEVDSGYDPRELMNDIKTRVDAINTFPSDAERPVINVAQRRREVISAVVAGDVSETELRQIAEQVRDDLTSLPDVTQVSLEGARAYEIAIEVPENILLEYNLRLSDVAAAVRSGSLDLSAGTVRSRGGDVLVSTKSLAYTKDQFSQIVLRTFPDGTRLTLGDIANIKDGFEENPVLTRFNGKRALELEVFRIGDQSAIEVANQVHAYIERKNKELPASISLGHWRDRSVIVKKRLNTLLENAALGGILVLGMLALFLRPAVAFWVVIGIPISFAGSMILLPYLGITLNIASLFGYILVLGIVVDDAIVTGENVYSHFRHGDDPLRAAIEGTQEVAIPVTFGILTTVAAFLPLAFVEGSRSTLFTQIPSVVIPVLLFSLVESKLVLPAHLKHMKRRTESKGWFTRFQQSVADGLETAMKRFYQPVLNKALSHYWLTLAIALSLTIVVVATVFGGSTRFVFFPRIQSEVARGYLTMPAGTPFEVTEKYMQRMHRVAQELKDKYRDPESGESVITNIMSITGRSGSPNVGRIFFEITPPEDRTLEISSVELVNQWRKGIGSIPGAEQLNFRAEIGRRGDPIDIQLEGQDLGSMKLLAEDVKKQLRQFPDVFDITDSLASGKQEARIKLTSAGELMGFRLGDVARQVREALHGFQVQRIQRGRDDVRVMVRYPAEARGNLETLNNMMLRGPKGQEVPLREVAVFETTRSPASIYRIDRKRTLNITADVNKKTADMALIKSEMSEFIESRLPAYQGVSFSFEGEAREQRESFGSLMWGTFFVFFVIYAMLAIPFKSYYQPLVVMSVIPFGIMGAIVGHWIMGMDLSIMSLMGILALTGVVVNDSLVLVDYINKKRREGLPLMEALSIAGARRFRPVLLTSLTTFAGLFPLLFEESTQARFLVPMAVSLGFGILFATFITLLVVPSNYLLFHNLARKFGAGGVRADDGHIVLEN